MSRIRTLMLLVLLAYIPTAWAVQISHVSHVPLMINPLTDEDVNIRFRLSEPATVTLNIFDGRDLLIRTISTESPLAAGDNTLQWDGKDQVSQPVPPEAYHYTLTAQAGEGEAVEYDVTDLTGIEPIKPRDIHWDSEARQLHYILPKPARVNIRVGLKNHGPLLGTLVNWVARTRGSQVERWDGLDASGVLDLTNHPQLDIQIEVFALSDNTIFIGPLTDTIDLVDITWDKTARVVKRTPEQRIHTHRQQPLTTRGEFSIQLVLPEGLQRNADGLPVITGAVPIRMEIDQADQARAVARRFEPVFYLDGQFVYELETGYLPITWRWDPKGVTPGIHYITANLRGYEGNFGIATVKVDVQQRSADNQIRKKDHES